MFFYLLIPVVLTAACGFLLTHKLGTAPAFGPFLSICTTVLFLMLAGICNLLFAGTIVWYAACAAALAVIDVMQDERLIENAASVGAYAEQAFAALPHVVAVKGRGLMLGVEFDRPVAELRKRLVFEKHIFTGSASNPAMIRFLPPLTIGRSEVDALCAALKDLTAAW